MHKDDYDALNLPGQSYRLYIAFLNEVQIGVDGELRTPPPTEYPSQKGQVPFRATAQLGPNRIGFVDEPVRWYGGYSFYRRRVSAIQHEWSTFLGETEITNDPAYVTMVTQPDATQRYWTEQEEPAYCYTTFHQPGIYTIALGVRELNQEKTTHIGYRQVAVYPSRNVAMADVKEISGLSGGIDQGGWGVQIRVGGDIDYLLPHDQVEGYIPVVIMAEYLYEVAYEEWEVKKFGIRDDINATEIIFNGYLDQESLEVYYDRRSASFTCRTADVILEDMQSHTWGFFEHPKYGTGIIFDDLETHDVIRYMLQEKSNFIDWHDVRLQHMVGMSGTNMEYRDWTWNAGQYWSNIRDIAENEFYKAYFDHQGALYVVPDRNMWTDDEYLDNSLQPYDPSYDMQALHNRSPMQFAHLNRYPYPVGDIAIDRKTEQTLVPFDISISYRHSANISYYKIVASLSFWNEEWGADYPKEKAALHSGNWILVQGKYYSDESRENAWNRIWQMAARGYYAASSRVLGIQASFQMNHYWRIGDVIRLTYADERAAFDETYFEIMSMDHAISIENGTWMTSLQLRYLTIYEVPLVSVPSIPEEVVAEPEASQ